MTKRKGTGFRQNLWTLYAIYVPFANVGDKLAGYALAGYVLADSARREDLPFAPTARVKKIISGYAKVESYRDFLRERHPESSLLCEHAHVSPELKDGRIIRVCDDCGLEDPPPKMRMKGE